MVQVQRNSAAEIRAKRAAETDLRDRDFADRHGLREAQLVAAYVGHGVTKLNADVDALMAQVLRLGAVMALTRNESCVIEKDGTYNNYHPGKMASIVLDKDIDLRIFAKHWISAFAVEKETRGKVLKSLQIFDAAGDAVHKIFLRDGSNSELWEEVVATLSAGEQSQELAAEDRPAVEGAKIVEQSVDELRQKWDKMTDTHQFFGILRGLKMNRLGAYRVAGAPYVRPLEASAVGTILERAAETQTPMMAFVGNQGCIEIHTGPIETVKRMGPWLNVLDPRFNLHLREDHVAEVYAVTKNTARGPAISVEAFRADGLLIAQFFGVLRGEDKAAGWNKLVADLPTLKIEEFA